FFFLHLLKNKSADRFLYQSVSLWYEWIFGSGTKLFVTGDPVVQPVVSVYPAASSAQRDRKGFLLCLASGMFPPEVQISWKRLEDGGEKDLTSGEQLELREPNRTASILLVDREPLSTSRYRCSVRHEGGPVEAPATQGEEAGRPGRDSAAAAAEDGHTFSSCSVPEVPGFYPPTDAEDLLQLRCRVKLLCLLYSVLIVKSLVYCCGLSLLMVLRTKG
uniref:Ig-like domain-containing protein n=1 Tax=Poecilia formosa TaxID=48698 RepID=A0A087X2R4_POEFO